VRWGKIDDRDPAGSSYKGFRFPPEIISHGVWLYHRFPLSFRDVQEMMLERGVDVSYETILKRLDAGQAANGGAPKIGRSTISLINE
jgi:hypothetical protein